MKIMVGCNFFASEKIAAVRFCDSPYHLSKREVTFQVESNSYITEHSLTKRTHLKIDEIRSGLFGNRFG